MPQLIVLRLHPAEPVNGADFTDYLEDLSITVSDLALDMPSGVQVVPIGTADYLPPTDLDLPQDPPEYDPDTLITQHFETIQNPIGPPTFQLVAVATAVIPIPGTPVEFLTSDLRIEVKRGTQTILKRDLDFNVALTANMATPDPEDFMGLEPVSLHIALPPPPLDANLDDAIIELPEDGSPPNFTDLYTAVRAVLIEDPDIADTDAAVQAKLETLTPAEARHIAYEIMYNFGVYPPPAPSRALAELYTLDFPDRDTDAANQARDLFEAESIGFKAIRSAQAERLSSYVFALAAAFQCQKMTTDAPQVGFEFPVHPDAPEVESASKIKQVEVILTN